MRADWEENLHHCHHLLPTLPAVALQVIGLVKEDPYSNLREIIKVITMDPALVVKLLRAANSSLYGWRRKSANLCQAINLLGLNATVTLVLSFSLGQVMHGIQNPTLDALFYWRRSLLAALASRSLGEQLGGAAGDLFLAGLLQDIGLLVLAVVKPAEFGSAVAAALQPGQSGAQPLDYDERLAASERERLGIDHAELGVWLLRRWNLPESLQWAVAGKLNPAAVDAPAELKTFIACVAVSGRIADTWLRPGDKAAAARAAQAAAQWLGLEAGSYVAVLDRMAEALPEVSSLFEIQILEPLRSAAILAEARELLEARSLQTIQAAAESQRQREALESRTRALEEQNRLDPLTGLLNRGWLDRTLRVEFEQAQEQQWPLSLAFIDIDHFKRINDQYGHPAGDAVLASFARQLTTHLRQGDIVGRYGGEEFLVVLPGVGSDAMHRLFTRLMNVIRQTEHQIPEDQTLRVTVSIGLATHRDKGQCFASADALLKAADQMVYRAKRHGRDQIKVYPAQG